MRSPEEVELVDGLIARGFNDCEIARSTGIPRRTVHDWRRGRRPDFSRVRQFRPGVDPGLEADAEPAYAYSLGLYLGDGHITRMPRTYRLRVALDGIYPEIVAECKAALERAVGRRPSVQKTASRAVIVSVYANALPQLFPQHGAGRKHERPIVLSDWQRAITRRHPKPLIRGLIHSDGCRSLNTIRGPRREYAYPRYQFTNHSFDIQGIFCEHLDLLGIPWRQMNRWNISVARRVAVARLDEFVGPKR